MISERSEPPPSPLTSHGLIYRGTAQVGLDSFILQRACPLSLYVGLQNTRLPRKA